MLCLLSCIAAFAAISSAAPQWSEHELVQVRAVRVILINGVVSLPLILRARSPALFSQVGGDMLVNVPFWRDICNKLDEKVLFLKLKSKCPAE